MLKRYVFNIMNPSFNTSVKNQEIVYASTVDQARQIASEMWGVGNHQFLGVLN